MKNKIKPILVIFIIFSAILGLSYYTNAAENLKAAQDKYRISYNNLTKALKEGADKERIDQLSAQCKEDYAEYQKASGKAGSINKANHTSVKPGKNVSTEQTIQNNIKTNVLIKKNQKVSQKKDIIKPSAPLKRINDKTVSDYELPDDKEFLERDNCENKVKCLKLLRNFKENLDNDPYIDAEYALSEILYKLYGLYPDIGAAAYMCYFQKSFKALENSYYSYEDCQKFLSLKGAINDFTNTYAQNTVSKNYYNVCGNILKELPVLTAKIDSKIKIFKTQYLETIKSISSLLKSDEEYFNSIETLNFHSTTNMPSASKISGMFNDIIVNYNLIIKSYVTIGDYNQAKIYIENLDNFYKGIKGKYELHYNDYVGQPMQTVTVDGIKKNPTIYLDVKNFYLEGVLKNNENVKSDEDVKKDAIQFVEYLNGIPHFDSEKNRIEMYADADQKDRLIDYWHNFSTNERNIDQISIGLYDSQKLIAESTDVLLVKCLTNFPGHGPLNVEVKSSVSNKLTKLTEFKKWNMNSGQNYYYTTFKPDTYNLIKKHGAGTDELKHSVCISDGLAENLQINWEIKPNALRTIKESSFYKNFLGEGVVRRKYDEPIERININTSFLQAMGFEILSVIDQNSSESTPKKGYCYVENQADWFVIQNHGIADADGAISLETGLTTCVWNIDSWHPQDLKINCSNINFVLFGCCSILNISKYKIDSNGDIEFPAPLNTENDINNGLKWAKKFSSNVVLLGYYRTVTGFVIDEIPCELVEYFNKTGLNYPYKDDEKKVVIAQWFRIHKKMYEYVLSPSYIVVPTCNIFVKLPKIPDIAEPQDVIDEFINKISKARYTREYGSSQFAVAIYNKKFHKYTNNYVIKNQALLKTNKAYKVCELDISKGL
jgi:hypothetical protein